jgi:plasmid stabilization system protein ParE
MAEIRRSPQAETDLEMILEDLQQRNPAVAERYATAFYDKGQILAQFPEIAAADRRLPPTSAALLSTLM